jgi:hypothetical protein
LDHAAFEHLVDARAGDPVEKVLPHWRILFEEVNHTPAWQGLKAEDSHRLHELAIHFRSQLL